MSVVDAVKKYEGYEVAIDKGKSTQLLSYFCIFLNKHFQRT